MASCKNNPDEKAHQRFVDNTTQPVNNTPISKNVQATPIVPGSQWDSIKNIERVFMHTPHEYSLLARNNGDDTLYVNVVAGVKPRFVDDVPRGKPMWALKSKESNGDGYYIIIIHIRSMQDVGGAGWETGGKHSTDEQTSVVR